MLSADLAGTSPMCSTRANGLRQDDERWRLGFRRMVLLSTPGC